LFHVPTSRLAFPLLAYAFAAIMLGTTVPTPMYALYAEHMDFAVLTTTVIYATYAGGVLFALLVFGRWSDAIGRRPMLLAGVAAALASAAVFLMADSVPLLLVGRVFSGLSAGIFTGTATAAVIEAAPESWRGRAAAVATVANMGGLGAGPLLAGFLVEYAPRPLHLSFVVHILLVVLAGLAVLTAPETSPRTGGLGVQRLSVPAEVRSVFVIASLAAFAGFAVTGLFMAVAPSFLAEVVGIGNHAVAGVVASSIFAASAVAQIAANRISPQRAVAVGCAILVVGMVILAVALHFSSLTGLIVAAIVAGAGQGISFSRGLAAVAERTPPERRAEVSSTYFVVAYVAISMPVVGVGLAAQEWGLRSAGVSFAVAVAVLAGVCLGAILLQEARQSRRAVAQV
jgi:MFS family permease